MNAEHPRPNADGDAGEFWAWLRAGELRVQCCDDCGRFRHPPQPVCAECGSASRSFVPAAGRGVVWSTTTIHAPVLPAFADRVPYPALVVRLDEGVFLVTNPVDDVAIDIGADVEVEFLRVHEALTLPLVRPA